MNSLTAGVFISIWLAVTVPTMPDTLNIEEVITVPVKATDESEVKLCESEFELLCKCVEAEAGDQGYLGKCYVIDCILNRRDQWNKTITEVIYQKGQFAVVSNGRINKIKVSEETRQAIRDELRCRTNWEMLYFRMDHYHDWITKQDPTRNLFSHGDHWFSR